MKEDGRKVGREREKEGRGRERERGEGGGGGKEGKERQLRRRGVKEL